MLVLNGCELSGSEDNEFPNKPISILVGYSAGGGSDQWARAIAAEATKTLGVDITVTNMAGKGGLDALEEYMTTARDGYTLMSVVDIYAAAVAKGDTEVNIASLTPLVVGNIVPSEIYIAANDPRFSTWADVQTYVQANPGATVASAGVELDLEGISIRVLENLFSMDLERVIITETEDRFMAPVTGTTDFLIEQSSDVKALVEDGTLKPILTLYNERIHPDVPAVSELDPTYPVLLRVRGLSVHSDVSADRIEFLKSGLGEAFASSGFQSYLQEKGMDQAEYPTEITDFWENLVLTYTIFVNALQQ